ncbi:hypothetical protein OH77DRAFT_252188 [Trametes cingulata]|nr:hypothetical protein OH77DRAFT_252188 [Trametes cingulata]
MGQGGHGLMHAACLGCYLDDNSCVLLTPTLAAGQSDYPLLTVRFDCRSASSRVPTTFTFSVSGKSRRERLECTTHLQM